MYLAHGLSTGGAEGVGGGRVQHKYCSQGCCLAGAEGGGGGGGGGVWDMRRAQGLISGRGGASAVEVTVVGAAGAVAPPPTAVFLGVYGGGEPALIPPLSFSLPVTG